MAREAVLWCVLVAFCLQTVAAKDQSPNVQVYTRYPVEAGKENIVQCYVNGFHPPKISISILKNGSPIESQQSDLSFDSNWTFHRLVYANVTTEKGSSYACRVEHETFAEPKTYHLEMF